MLRWTIPTFSVWPNIPADATASRISCWGSRVAVPFRETFKAVDGVPCRMSRRASAAWMVDRTSSLLATRLGPGQSTIVNGVEHVAVRTFRMRDFASSWVREDGFCVRNCRLRGSWTALCVVWWWVCL